MAVYCYILSFLFGSVLVVALSFLLLFLLPPPPPPLRYYRYYYYYRRCSHPRRLLVSVSLSASRASLETGTARTPPHPLHRLQQHPSTATQSRRCLGNTNSHPLPRLALRPPRKRRSLSDASISPPRRDFEEEKERDKTHVSTRERKERERDDKTARTNERMKISRNALSPLHHSLHASFPNHRAFLVSIRT